MCGGKSLWTSVRDTVEGAGAVAGNYLLPGSSLLTNNLVSKGAQKELNSPIGKIAEIGAGLAGGGVGESVTGIPSASEIGAGWTNAANAVGGVFGDPTLGTDVSSGISSILGKAENALGIGGEASGAAPITGVSSSELAAPEGALSSAAPVAAPVSLGEGASAADTEFLKNAGVNAGNIAGGSEFNAALAAQPSFSPVAADAIGGKAGGVLNGLIPSASTLEKAALPAGMLAYNAIKGPPPLTAEGKALGVGGAATQPLLDTEKQQLGIANSGQISAPQQQQITNFVNEQQNELIQQLASQGVTNMAGDSRFIQGMQQIREKAIALQQQFIAQALQAGTAAAGAAAGNLNSAAQQSLQNDTNFQSALSSAVGSLGNIFGSTPSKKSES